MCRADASRSHGDDPHGSPDRPLLDPRSGDSRSDNRGLFYGESSLCLVGDDENNYDDGSVIGYMDRLLV